MQILVEVITTKTITLDVQQSDTIEAIKAKIHEIEGILPEKQNLTILGSQVQDRKTLSEHGIGEQSTLQLKVSNEAKESGFRVINRLLAEELKLSNNLIKEKWDKDLNTDEKTSLAENMARLCVIIAGLLNKIYEYITQQRLTWMLDTYNITHVTQEYGADLKAVSKHNQTEFYLDHKNSEYSSNNISESDWNVLVNKKIRNFVENTPKNAREIYKQIIPHLKQGFYIFTVLEDGKRENEYYLSNHIIALIMAVKLANFKKDVPAVINLGSERCKKCKNYHRLMHLYKLDQDEDLWNALYLKPDQFENWWSLNEKKYSDEIEARIETQDETRCCSRESFYVFLERFEKRANLFRFYESLSREVWNFISEKGYKENLANYYRFTTDPNIKFIQDWIAHFQEDESKIDDLLKHLHFIPGQHLQWTFEETLFVYENKRIKKNETDLSDEEEDQEFDSFWLLLSLHSEIDNMKIGSKKVLENNRWNCELKLEKLYKYLGLKRSLTPEGWEYILKNNHLENLVKHQKKSIMSFVNQWVEKFKADEEKIEDLMKHLDSLPGKTLQWNFEEAFAAYEHSGPDFWSILSLHSEMKVRSARNEDMSDQNDRFMAELERLKDVLNLKKFFEEKVWKCVLKRNCIDILRKYNHSEVLSFINNWIEHFLNDERKIDDLIDHLDIIPQRDLKWSFEGLFEAYNTYGFRFWLLLRFSSQISEIAVDFSFLDSESQIDEVLEDFKKLECLFDLEGTLEKNVWEYLLKNKDEQKFVLNNDNCVYNHYTGDQIKFIGNWILHFQDHRPIVEDLLNHISCVPQKGLPWDFEETCQDYKKMSQLEREHFWSRLQTFVYVETNISQNQIGGSGDEENAY